MVLEPEAMSRVSGSLGSKEALRTKDVRYVPKSERTCATVKP